MITSVISKHEHKNMWVDMKATALLKHKKINRLFQSVHLKLKIM